MSTLYELGQDFNKLNILLDEGDIDQATFDDTLESISLDLGDKLVGCQIIRQRLLDEAESINNEVERLKARAKSRTKNAEDLKQRMLQSIELSNLDRVKTDLWDFTPKNTPPAVKVTNELLLLKKYYIKQQPKLSITAIKEDLKAGKLVKGAELTTSRTLMIK